MNEMMTLYTLGDRLREARLEKGFTLEQAAERVGVRLNTVWCYEKNKFRPSEPVLRLCTQIYDKPYEWFFGEEEEPQAHAEHLDAEAPDSPATAGSPSVIGSLAQVRQEFSARFDRLESAVSRIAAAEPDDTPTVRPVEVVEVAAAAGGGAEVYDETVVGRLWFRDDWLDRQAIDPDQCNVISVRGESMEPTLPDGCSILVDRKRRESHEGRIYVMQIAEGLVVKRMGLDEEAQWELRSDNPAWPPVPWSDTTEIIGEVRWAARTF